MEINRHDYRYWTERQPDMILVSEQRDRQTGFSSLNRETNRHGLRHLFDLCVSFLTRKQLTNVNSKCQWPHKPLHRFIYKFESINHKIMVVS